MKVAIIGAGAMGSLFASHLAEGGAQVWAIDTWREHVEAMQRRGLRVSRSGSECTFSVQATTEPGEVGPCDAVMIFVKYGQTASAMKAARPMIGPETLIVTLQNGIGNVDIVEQSYPDSQVAFGLTTLTSEIIGPGHIEASYDGRGETYVWSDRGTTYPLERMCGVLNNGGIDAFIEPGIHLKIWKKLVVNCCLNTACAITDQTVGALIDGSDVWPLFDNVVHEIVQVAQKKGIPLEPGETRSFLRSVAEAARNHQPSMMVDLRNGRMTEIECLNGAVLRECSKHGIAAPSNQALYAMVRALEQAPSRRMA